MTEYEIDVVCGFTLKLGTSDGDVDDIKQIYGESLFAVQQFLTKLPGIQHLNITEFALSHRNVRLLDIKQFAIELMGVHDDDVSSPVSSGN